MNVVSDAIWIIVFILPGYLVFKLKESVIETKTLSRFELTLQSFIYSGLIYSTYFILPTRNLVDTAALIGTKTIETVLSKNFLYASLWVVGFTGIWGSIVAFAAFHDCLYGILRKLKFHRLNRYLTTWEQFADMSRAKWVSVELTDGYTYVGVLISVTHYPYEKELILGGATHKNEFYPVRIYNSYQKREESKDPPEFVLIPQSQIKTLSLAGISR